MKLLSHATADDLLLVVSRAVDAFSGTEYFEHAAQALVRELYVGFDKSMVMARAYVTVPMRVLPASNAAWVRNLARAKGIEAELSDETRVISLVGSAGRRAPWNDRRASQGHVGIPMTSASFIDAIPMMSRLMASLGGNLQWIDSEDASHVISRLGTVAGTFYVEDAARETDAIGRKVISATDFVAENGIRTVFGLGGAFASGQLLVLLVFCDEFVPRGVVDKFQGPFLRFKAAAAPLLGRVFADGGVTKAGLEQPKHHTEAVSPPEEGTRGRELASKQHELEALNALYLELESQLEHRTRSLRLILESTGDGLLLVDFEGKIVGETTAAVTRWFGPSAAGIRISDVLFGRGSVQAKAFEEGFEQLVEDVLPFEVTSSQMPQRLSRGSSTWSLVYRQVFERERFVRVLIVIQDITAELAAERAQAQARELHAVVGSILRDRTDFRRFIAETGGLIEAIATAGEPGAQLRDLHTLKGNTAIYGFRALPTLVHEIEGELCASSRVLGADRMEGLRRAWAGALSIVADFVGGEEGARVEIRLDEHADFLRRLGAGEDVRRLSRIARSWRDEPTATILSKLAAQARRLGEQLGKQLEVSLEDSGARVPLEVTQRYWGSLVHAIRNAVDHGLERTEARSAAGKPTRGRLTLSCNITQDSLVVTVADDGKGIDWDAVRARAQELGLAHEGRQDLIRALLSGGLSTRAQVNETSGRGVGLSALSEACRALGGQVEIESTPGNGTTLRATLAWSSIVRPSSYPDGAAPAGSTRPAAWLA